MHQQQIEDILCNTQIKIQPRRFPDYWQPAAMQYPWKLFLSCLHGWKQYATITCVATHIRFINMCWPSFQDYSKTQEQFSPHITVVSKAYFKITFVEALHNFSIHRFLDLRLRAFVAPILEEISAISIKIFAWIHLLPLLCIYLKSKPLCHHHLYHEMF